MSQMAMDAALRSAQLRHPLDGCSDLASPSGLKVASRFKPMPEAASVPRWSLILVLFRPNVVL